MSMKPRPSLAGRFAKKETATAIVDQASAPKADAVRTPAVTSGDKRVQVLVRMTPAERKALRRIALDQDTTVQSIVEDAIRDVLRRHGG